MRHRWSSWDSLYPGQGGSGDYPKNSGLEAGMHPGWNGNSHNLVSSIQYALGGGKKLKNLKGTQIDTRRTCDTPSKAKPIRTS